MSANVARALVVVILCANAASWAQDPLARRRLTKQEVVEALQNGVTAPRVLSLAKQYGINFDPLAASSDIKAAGGDEKFVAALHDVAHGQAESNYNAGQLFLKSSDFESAAGQFQEALKLDGGYVDADIALADVYAARGDNESAKASLSRLITAKPDSAVPHVHLARIYESEEDWNHAVSSLKTAVELDPADTKVRDAYEALMQRATKRVFESVVFRLGGETGLRGLRTLRCTKRDPRIGTQYIETIELPEKARVEASLPDGSRLIAVQVGRDFWGTGTGSFKFNEQSMYLLWTNVTLSNFCGQSILLSAKDVLDGKAKISWGGEGPSPTLPFALRLERGGRTVEWDVNKLGEVIGLQFSKSARSIAGSGEQSDFRYVGAAMLPFHYAAKFDINGAQANETQYDSIQWNPPLPPETFTPPPPLH